MCHTEVPQQMPMNTGAPAGASSLPDPNASDPLSSAIHAMEASQPKTTSPSAPTKFGTLLKILGPALEGGTIGAFGGHGHPGGGFGAAQEFYDTQRRERIQKQMLQNTLENSRVQRALEVARTNHQVNQPYFTGGRPTAAQDEEGNDVLLQKNPFNGVMEPVPGYRPPARPDRAPKTEMTDQGLMVIGPDGKATPVERPSAAAPRAAPASTGIVQTQGKASPMFVARKPGSGTAEAKPSSGAPLHAPGFGKPQHQNDFERFYDKYLDDNGLEDTAANQLKARSAYEAAGRKPDREGPTPKESAKRRQHFTDQLNREFADSEKQRSKDIAALAKDQTLMPEERTARQAQIEEDNADRKQTLHQRIADLASGEGIDIGGPGDYHAQSSGGGQSTNTAPNAPKNGSNKGKVAYPADVGAWAAKKNITLAQARAQFRARGYKFADTPQ